MPSLLIPKYNSLCFLVLCVSSKSSLLCSRLTCAACQISPQALHLPWLYLTSIPRAFSWGPHVPLQLKLWLLKTRAGHLDGDRGSTHLLFLHHISTTKGIYFVAAHIFLFLPFSWFQKKMPLGYALNTSGTAYKCPSNLFICHCSELPMLQTANAPFLSSGIPWQWSEPFSFKASSHGTETRQFLIVISSDCWVFCLQTHVKLYHTYICAKSRVLRLIWQCMPPVIMSMFRIKWK